jgi:hypothetical protein
MSPRLVLAAFLVAASAFLPTAAADPCPTYTHRVATTDHVGVPGVLGLPTGIVHTTVEFNEQAQVRVSLAKGNFYVVVDEVGTEEWLVSYWVYQEYNGEGGLQRHDDYCQDPGYSPFSSDANIT